ncbi:PucR-like helix-turn-helix protein [Prauserella shujinwangii]|uniref:PucR-like helix-turn-helix protein n=1 Tax=Prauserella shujinwangii TaxID=1453103 RepID=A0A2T0LL46_9PSEU|nr:PucR family transcriptional regulator [Prauserella shujinwangii]PRX43666.1 PucR-like helix-turn-helix protein [Prauserella shujinwangii]
MTTPGTPAEASRSDPVRRATEQATSLWASLPRDLSERFGPLVEGLTREIVREVRHAVPAYSGPLGAGTLEDLVSATRQAVLRGKDAIRAGAEPDPAWQEVFRRLGRVEFRNGRNLDALQAAYRVGGRVAWRHIAVWGQRERLPTELFAIAAEAIFAYVEQLSALSIEGYTAAQAECDGVRARHRRRLAQQIVADPPPAGKEIARLSTLGHWPLPEEVAVVAVAPDDEAPELSAAELGDDILADVDSGQPCLVVAHPERAGERLGRLLAGRRACVGPTVPLAEAPVSLRWARRGLRLAERGALGAEPVVWCRDHLTTLCLLADEFLVEELRRRVLAPLAPLTPNRRARTVETALAWLESRGNAPAVAGRLGIHPQTVRYRMRQVTELLGDRLGDPAARLELELALRAERLLARE